MPAAMDTSDQPAGSWYRVVETAEFQRQVARLPISQRHWDDVKEDFDEEIARRPHRAQPIPGTALRAIPILTLPPLIVFYAVDDDAREVILVEVRVL